MRAENFIRRDPNQYVCGFSHARIKKNLLELSGLALIISGIALFILRSSSWQSNFPYAFTLCMLGKQALAEVQRIYDFTNPAEVERVKNEIKTQWEGFQYDLVHFPESEHLKLEVGYFLPYLQREFGSANIDYYHLIGDVHYEDMKKSVEQYMREPDKQYYVGNKFVRGYTEASWDAAMAQQFCFEERRRIRRAFILQRAKLCVTETPVPPPSQESGSLSSWKATHLYSSQSRTALAIGPQLSVQEQYYQSQVKDFERRLVINKLSTEKLKRA